PGDQHVALLTGTSQEVQVPDVEEVECSCCVTDPHGVLLLLTPTRSEERRVGKAGRGSRRASPHETHATDATAQPLRHPPPHVSPCSSVAPLVGCFFFFSSRRRHTISKRDWSSDVCSSDLPGDQHVALLTGTSQEVQVPDVEEVECSCCVTDPHGVLLLLTPTALTCRAHMESLPGKERKR